MADLEFIIKRIVDELLAHEYCNKWIPEGKYLNIEELSKTTREIVLERSTNIDSPEENRRGLSKTLRDVWFMEAVLGLTFPSYLTLDIDNVLRGVGYPRHGYNIDRSEERRVGK